MRDFETLLGIAFDAIGTVPPMQVPAIFGQPWTWLPPHHRYSEFGLLDPWRLRRAFSYLVDVTVPSIPRTPPPFGPPLLERLFWHTTVILQRPDHYGSFTSFPDEAWFFLNGILTNDTVAQLNAAYLADLFHRPITLIQNATGGLLTDLLECALGKQWHRTTEAALKSFPPIYEALKGPRRRVVVVAHSQGTIIAAVVLRLLAAKCRPSSAAAKRAFAGPEFVYPPESFDLDDFEDIGPDELAKLELYCFANCANTMTYVRPAAGGERPSPWIESFGNEHDLVARLGMLAPRAKKWSIAIDGPIFRRTGAWGHLLNEHYLAEIERRQRTGHRRGGCGGAEPYELVNAEAFPEMASPRLFGYLNGGSPD